MHRFRLFAAVMAAVLVIFCSCGETFDISVLVSDENANINELITRTYSSEQLKEMIIFTNLEQMNEEYPVECLRKIDSSYQAIFKGDKTIMLIDFDESGLRMGSESHKVLANSEGFDELAIGDTIRNVRELDPAGDYLFLYTGDNSLPRESIHYIESGYVFTITYDNGNVITAIDKRML